MDSKKLIFLLLFICFVLFMTAAEDSFRMIPNGELSYHWQAYYGEDETMLDLICYKNGRVHWRYSHLDETFYDDRHEVPLTAYALYDGVLTFPLTLLQESGRLKRFQVALDGETGALLWEKETSLGVAQNNLYSFYHEGRLYIHNLHEYKGAQLLCVDLKSGKTIWESEGPPEAAYPLFWGEKLVLPAGNLARLYIYDSAGRLTDQKSSSSYPVIWRDSLVYLDYEADSVFLNIISDDRSSRYPLGGRAGEDFSIFSLSRSEDFKRHVTRSFIPFLIYDDKIFIQKERDGISVLRAYELLNEGREGRSIELPQQYKFGFRRDFYSGYALGYYMSKPPVQAYGKGNTGFSEGAVLPVLLYESHEVLEYTILNRLALIDLENYRVEIGEAGLYESQFWASSILNSQGTRYLLLERNSESEKNNLLLRFSSDGTVDSWVEYPKDITDNSVKGQDAPYNYILLDRTDLVEWKPFDEGGLDELGEGLLPDAMLKQ
ncbi:MAG: PQQ-binding-like beta-propeller repeat protein [Spirochaetales bacterium]|nr:PQQ-binding-like beta-propeller repeat protein [Spirochaetales bacterium]